MARSTWFIRRWSGPRTATTMQKAEAPDASVAPGGREHLVEGQEGVPLGRRVVVHGLRAEGAVLGAAAGLRADERLELDALTPPAPAHLVGEGEQPRQLGRRQADQLPGLVDLDRALLLEQRPLEAVQDARSTPRSLQA